MGAPKCDLRARLMDVEPALNPALTGVDMTVGVPAVLNPPKIRKSVRIPLRPDATTDAVVADILGACWSHAAANTAAAFDGRDPEGVHQMRVGLRRLRTALVLLKPVLASEKTKWVGKEVKWINSTLGPARDWDVLMMETLGAVRRVNPDDADLEVLANSAGRRREYAYDDVRKMIQSNRFATFSELLPEWLEGRGWRVKGGQDADLMRYPAIILAGKLLNKRHKKALKLGRDLAGQSGEQLHPLRIELKKLRYASEFFRSLYESDQEPLYLSALKKMQDDLGHLNDVAVAARLLADLPASAKKSDTKAALKAGRNTLIEWYGNNAADTADALSRDWDEFTHMKPFWR